MRAAKRYRPSGHMNRSINLAWIYRCAFVFIGYYLYTTEAHEKQLTFINSKNSETPGIVYKLRPLSESRVQSPPEILDQYAHLQQKATRSRVFCDAPVGFVDTDNDQDASMVDTPTCFTVFENERLQRQRNVYNVEGGPQPQLPPPLPASPVAEPLLQTLKKVLQATKRLLHFFAQDLTGMNTDAVLGINMAEGECSKDV